MRLYAISALQVVIIKEQRISEKELNDGRLNFISQTRIRKCSLHRKIHHRLKVAGSFISTKLELVLQDNNHSICRS
jgi:hypothetical protein